MRLAIYAHPFDLEALGDHGGLARLRDLGFAEVALATSYHDGRWLMPWHPGGRVRFLEDGAVHFRPTSDYGELEPLESGFVPPQGPSPLEMLCAAALDHDLGVRAWTVFTHNSRLGGLHPELCVQNALGDRYLYALCPSQPAVQRYVQCLAQDLGAQPGLGALEFEAFGWMGWKHSSHHDKASFAPRGWLDRALSLCLCPACQERIDAAGGDTVAVRAWAAGLIRDAVERGDAMDPQVSCDAAMATALLEPVMQARAGTMREVFTACCKRMAPGVRRAVQVHPDAGFTGSQLAAPLAAATAPQEVVITAYGEGPAAIEALLAHPGMAAFTKVDKRLSIWPKAPQCNGDEDLMKIRRAAEQHGVQTIAIYHLGLLPWRTIERAAKILCA